MTHWQSQSSLSARHLECLDPVGQKSIQKFLVFQSAYSDGPTLTSLEPHCQIFAVFVVGDGGNPVISNNHCLRMQTFWLRVRFWQIQCGRKNKNREWPHNITADGLSLIFVPLDKDRCCRRTNGAREAGSGPFYLYPLFLNPVLDLFGGRLVSSEQADGAGELWVQYVSILVSDHQIQIQVPSTKMTEV